MESGKGREERKKEEETYAEQRRNYCGAKFPLFLFPSSSIFLLSSLFSVFFFPLSSYLSHYSVLRPIRLDLDEPFANTKRERVKEIEKKVAGEWIPKER